MDINHAAPFVSRNETYIDAPPEAVWELLADIDGWSKWQQGVSRAKLEGPLAAGTRFKWKAGGLSISSELQVIEQGRIIGWTGKALGTYAVDIWQLEPHEGGTQVTTIESLEGWLARLIRPFMPRFLQKQKAAALADLKQAAETREL